MTNNQGKNLIKQRRPKSSTKLYLVLFGLFICWSIALGSSMAKAIAPPDVPATSTSFLLAQNQNPNPDSTTDSLQIGRKVYLENCSSCHVPIPPEVLPTETWRELLENPQNHYGADLPTIFSPAILLMWEYLRTFSRAASSEAVVPKIVEQSRYFHALHPRVELPKVVTHRSCIVCHPGAEQLDYRSLTAEWENAP